MLLIACGAGAGVGAVYNVPLAGALLAAELYMGSITLTTVAPALLTAAIATVIGWLALPVESVYHLPVLAYPGLPLLVGSLLSGPLIGLAAVAYVRLIAWAEVRRPSGRALLIEPPIAFAILGLASIAYPLLLGNGRDLAQFAFTGAGAVTTLAALALLKPLMTALCLRSGASGGLFTPTLSLGAVLGALIGHAVGVLAPGADIAAFAVAGAAAMLAAGMQAPIAAVAFTVELTGTVNASMVAILITVAGAVLVARRLEPRSIYSVRLPAEVSGAGVRGGGAAPSGSPPRSRRAGRHPQPRSAAPPQAAGGHPHRSS
jgi:H+/Cl- antiporter ClcA